MKRGHRRRKPHRPRHQEVIGRRVAAGKQAPRRFAPPAKRRAPHDDDDWSTDD